MAISPVRLEDMDGNTVHSFASESFVLYATIRAGSIRGRTRSASAGTVDRAGRAPAWGGRSWAADLLLVDYWIDPAVVATHETYLMELEAVFSQDDDDGLGRLWFVVDEEGTEKRCLCAPEALQPSDQSDHEMRLGHFIGRFTMLDGVWCAASTSSVAAAAKSSSPATVSVVNGPAKSEEAVITLKPTAAKAGTAGQRYRYPISVKWINPWPAHQHPVEITGGGWDHATEVTATRSAASGNDVEVRIGGRRVPRWASAWNGAAIKIWANMDIPAARYWTIRTGASLATAATSTYVEEPLINMPPLPFHAWVDNEVILVTAYNADAGSFTVERGKRGTTDADHTAADLIYWLPQAQMVDLVYGYTSAGSPDYIDDDYKPIIALTSTNTSHVYTSFQETATAARTQARKPRSGSWFTLDVVDRGKDHQYQNYLPYTAGINPSPADAATATKMALGYRSAGAIGGHPFQTAWAVRVPVGITAIQYDYWISIQWPSGRREARMHTVGIDRDGNRAVLATIYDNDGIPDSATATPTVASNLYEIRFELECYDFQPQEPDDGDGFEIDNVTFTLDSNEAPTPLWGGSRQDIYEFGRPGAPATLANSEGVTLGLNAVVPLNETLRVRVAERDVLDSDDVGYSHLATGTYPWLPGGTNNVTYTETGIGTVDIGVSSYRKAWH